MKKDRKVKAPLPEATVTQLRKARRNDKTKKEHRQCLLCPLKDGAVGTLEEREPSLLVLDDAVGTLEEREPSLRGPSGAVPTPGWRCGNPGGEGAQSAGPSGAKPKQGEGPQSARPDSAEKPNLVGPIITPNGRRFHRSSGCPTLAQSWKGRKPLCGECGDTYLVADVMMMDKNQLVHTKKTCSKVVGELIGYDACQRCA